jgi:DNA-binding NarL/FixJ family response regulator
MNFLIVEDNENMRRMIRSIVAEMAGETYECADGSGALAAYAEHRPDWVLMDVKMNQMDGITATRQIKKAFPQANIMIVSDYDDHDLRLAAREAGASEYVIKESLLDLCHILRARSVAEGATLLEKGTE